MLLFLDDEDLKDAEFMSALEDELKEAEKICKSYGYYGEFYIDYKKKLVHVNITEPRDGYFGKIYINSDCIIEIQTTSYGPLGLNEYNEFLNDCKKSMMLAEKLQNTLYICSQLVKD